MPDFKAKMHQTRFPLGSISDPAGVAYSAPDSQAVLRETTLREEGREGGRDGKGGRNRKGRGKKGKAKGKGSRVPPPRQSYFDQTQISRAFRERKPVNFCVVFAMRLQTRLGVYVELKLLVFSSVR